MCGQMQPLNLPKEMQGAGKNHYLLLQTTFNPTIRLTTVDGTHSVRLALSLVTGPVNTKGNVIWCAVHPARDCHATRYVLLIVAFTAVGMFLHELVSKLLTYGM
jgi:hypothetical protein